MEAQAGLIPWVEEFLQYQRSERAVSAHTLTAYRNDLKEVMAFLQKQNIGRWQDLTPETLGRYSSTLGPPLAVSTAQRRLSALRSFLKFLVRENKIDQIRLPSTGGFKKPKLLPKALSIEQLEKVLEAPNPHEPEGLRDRALLELIYGAGLRVSEACELNIAELIFDEDCVRVRGKRGKVRTVPLPEQTIEWLKLYLKEARPRLIKSPTQVVFLNLKGKPLTRQWVYARLEALCKKAGLPDGIGPHVLRHTYAVHLLKGGADLRSVQELLGHESISTTQIYTKLDVDEVRRRYLAAHPRK
ncbi:MAG: tyrosine recombinase XerC [Armatimonadetes bacterium]|nr:tyrosine recombinase XerC [Armatimonadota bacterium]